MYLIFLMEPCTKTVILRIQAYFQRETDRQTDRHRDNRESEKQRQGEETDGERERESLELNKCTDQ